MKRNLILCAITILSLSCLSSNAQKVMPQFNHLAVTVFNFEKSNSFYQNIIGLDTVPEPFKDGKHTWYKIGQNAFLHIIAGATGITSHPKGNHLCFSVESIDSSIQKLNKAGIHYEDWSGKSSSVTLRPDGVKQIYLQDPDGYWLEINNDR